MLVLPLVRLFKFCSSCSRPAFLPSETGHTIPENSAGLLHKQPAAQTHPCHSDPASECSGHSVLPSVREIHFFPVLSNFPLAHLQSYNFLRSVLQTPENFGNSRRFSIPSLCIRAKCWINRMVPVAVSLNTGSIIKLIRPIPCSAISTSCWSLSFSICFLLPCSEIRNVTTSPFS